MNREAEEFHISSDIKQANLEILRGRLGQAEDLLRNTVDALRLGRGFGWEDAAADRIVDFLPELLESVQHMDAMLKAEGAQGEREACTECDGSGNVYGVSGDGPWSCYACTDAPEVIGYANGDELDNMLDDRTAVLSPVKTGFHTVPVYWQARAALAQPSPIINYALLHAYACENSIDYNVLCAAVRDSLAQPSPAPELASFQPWEAENIAFVLRNIGAMEAEDIDGDNVDLRFEDADGRDTGCDVSIVEYAEKAADLIEAILAGAPVAQAGQVPDAELLSDIDKHLTDWLDLHECECENGHICGRGHVRATRDKVRTLLAAAPAQGG